MPPSSENGAVRLFVYGTLTDRYIVSVITGQEPHAEDATLEGYEKVTSLQSYPYIIPRPGAEVAGLLIHGLNAQALARLDEFEAEGKLYVRKKVTVRAGGGPTAADAYVAGPDILSSRPLSDIEVADLLGKRPLGDGLRRGEPQRTNRVETIERGVDEYLRLAREPRAPENEKPEGGTT